MLLRSDRDILLARPSLREQPPSGNPFPQAADCDSSMKSCSRTGPCLPKVTCTSGFKRIASCDARHFKRREPSVTLSFPAQYHDTLPKRLVTGGLRCLDN